MSGELGLQNSFRERVWKPLQRYRGSDGEAGREISLVEFMQTRAINDESKPVGLLNTAGQPISMNDLWCDLGLDPARITLENVLTLSEDVKYLAPEIVREFVLKGFNSNGAYTDIVAGTESVDQMVVTAPWVQMNDSDPEAIGETERIPEADYEWGYKTVRLSKKAKAIHASDELLLSVKLPLLSYFLQRFGVQLSAQLYNEGVMTLVNGDQADASDACAVIGVASTSDKLTYKDFLRAWIRGRRIAMGWTNLISNEATAYKLMQLAEFSNQQGLGGVKVTLQPKNQIVPASMPQLVSEGLSDDQAMLFDKGQAMVYLSFRALMVESERIIMRQINGSAASLIGGFTTLFREARVILDGDLAFSGNDFPSYMVPLS